MPGYDLPGGDYNTTTVHYADFRLCERACDADTRCLAWTYRFNGMGPPVHAACSLKDKVPAATGPSDPTTLASGVKDPDHLPPPGTIDTLRMMPDDTILSIRAYVDRSLTEVFWQNGRVAMTIATPSASGTGMAVAANASVEVMESKVWSVEAIWTSTQQVLATPRGDR